MTELGGVLCSLQAAARFQVAHLERLKDGPAGSLGLNLVYPRCPAIMQGLNILSTTCTKQLGASCCGTRSLTRRLKVLDGAPQPL
jgi:hypothetical protein